MRMTTTSYVIVPVTEDVRRAFTGVVVKGNGGFQALCRRIVEEVERRPETLQIDTRTFQRIVKYTRYGGGGFQRRFRVLIESQTGTRRVRRVRRAVA